jgi:transposase
MGHVTDPCGVGGTQRFQKLPAPIGSDAWKRWDEQLPPDHIARVIQEALPRLDLEPLRKSYSGCGSPAFRPELMLAMVLVEKHHGRCSPSQWHRDQSDRISLLWIGQGIRPSRGIWYQFRDRVGPFLDQWLSEIIRLAEQAGLTTATDGVVDGTLIAASASKHRLLNEKQLTSRLQQLDGAIRLDEQPIPSVQQPSSDQQHPAERQPGWMAKTPSGRRQQQTRHLRAEKFLQRRLETNARKIPSEQQSPDRVVISVSDPEAALGPDKFKVFRPLYNSLVITDRQSPLILGYEVFAHGQDTPLLFPTITHTETLIGHKLKRLTGDSGFITGRNLALSRTRDLELFGPWKVNDFSEPAPKKFYDKDQFVWHAEDHEYECPAGERLKRFSTEKRARADGHEELLERFKTGRDVCAACALRAACTKNKDGRQIRRSEYEDDVVAHRAKMETPEAKALLKTRGQIIERSFADLKEHRGLRRHTGRGLDRVRIDTGLAVLTHNLITLHKMLKPGTEPRAASP